MASNIKSQTNTNVQFFTATNQPQEQLLATATLAVAAGTSAAVFTSDPGTPPILVTKIAQVAKTAVTGANTVQANIVNPGSASVVAVTAGGALNPATVGAVGVALTVPSTATILQGGGSVTVTQATGSAGTINVHVFGLVLPQI